MNNERKTVHVGLRVTPAEYEFFARLAANVSSLEGRRVKISQLIMRLIDAGLPVLQDEAGLNFCHENETMFRNVSLLSVRRTFRSGLDRLDKLITSNS